MKTTITYTAEEVADIVRAHIDRQGEYTGGLVHMKCTSTVRRAFIAFDGCDVEVEPALGKRSRKDRKR